MNLKTFLVLAGVAVFLVWFKRQPVTAPSGNAKASAATGRPPSSVGFNFGAADIGSATRAAELAVGLFGGYIPPPQGSTALMVTGSDGTAEELRRAQLEFVN